MILPAQKIRERQPIEPFHERTVHEGMTFGLGPAGYDVRIEQTLILQPKEFRLASTVEYFRMPNDLMAQVCDKSSWARLGVTVQNTIIEPGWYGYLTLELVNHNSTTVAIRGGSPIAQIIFMALQEATDSPYSGKYQDQEAGPQSSRFE